MSSNRKLVAILGGRPYKDCLVLRTFLPPKVRDLLKQNGVDFIVATNNPKSAEQFEQIKGLKVVRTSEEIRDEFMSRQREIKPNLGAETRETINQYAIQNGYEYAVHLDDNIMSLFYYYDFKNRLVKKNKPAAMFDIIMLLFNSIEKSNMGALGVEMSAFAPSHRGTTITSGFPYSLFVHRVDKDFKFENSTEDDIIMSIYNGKNGKPSGVIRNALLYGKTGKKSSGGGNRKMYNEMLKENKRGEYAAKMWPSIYSRKVSYNVKSSTKQKEPFLQHKHTLIKPKNWDKNINYDKSIISQINETVKKIAERELA